MANPGAPEFWKKNLGAESLKTLAGFLFGPLEDVLAQFCHLPDTRKDPSRATFSNVLLKFCLLLWMLSGGSTCVDFGNLIKRKEVTETLNRLLDAPFPGSSCRSNDGNYVLPGIDVLRLEMERIDPEKLRMVWESCVLKLKELGVYRKLEVDGRLLIAIDGTDCFSTKQKIAKLLHRKSGKNVLYYTKLALASVVGLSFGSGMPIAGMMIQNGPEIEAATGSEACKQACEQGALRSVLERLANLCDLSKTIILLDGLYLNGVVMRLLAEFKAGWFITLKDDAATLLHEKIEVEMKRGGVEKKNIDDEYQEGKHHINEHYEIAWCNNVTHNFSGTPTPDMSYLSVIVTRYEDSVEKATMKFAWVTNIHLSENNVVLAGQVARRRWGVETQNNGQKNQGLHITHKYDSIGYAPENFLYMAQIADLIRKVFLYSDLCDQAAKTAEYYSVPVRRNETESQGELKEKKKKLQTTEAQIQTPEAVSDQPANRTTLEKKLGEEIAEMRKWRKAAAKEFTVKYWTSTQNFCQSLIDCLKSGRWDGIPPEPCHFEMRWKEYKPMPGVKLKWQYSRPEK